MYISSEDWLYIGLGLLGIIVLIFVLYSMNRISKNRNECNKWFEQQCIKYGLKNEGNIILGESVCNDFTIYTPEEYIYIANKNTKTLNKVLKDSILNVETEVYSIEKNVKKLIALTSTYSKNVKLSSVVLKIFTNNQTYNINCIINGKDGNGAVIINPLRILDDVKRCNLLLENDIKNLNKNNN